MSQLSMSKLYAISDEQLKAFQALKGQLAALALFRPHPK
jgi:hypothetical protein